MHASFGFTHTTTIDIPEMDLWEQDVALDLAIDGLLESHEIEGVAIRTHGTTTPIKDQGLADKIAARFNADDLAVDAMYDAAHDHLHNSI